MPDKIEIKSHEIVVFIISAEDYSKRLIELIKYLANNYKKICYVSLNKPYAALLEMLKQNGVNPERFYFVDCASKEAEANKKVRFISSPKALTELNIVIREVHDNVDAILFDSISTLLIYNDTKSIIGFAHDVISMVKSSNKTMALPLSESRTNSELLGNLGMFADRVVDLRKIEITPEMLLKSGLVKVSK